jgi:hypothetical protein
MTTRTLLTAIAMLLAIALFQCAQAATVGLHLYSLHVPAKDSDNNLNGGLYVRTDSGLTFGMYRSTLRRNAPYIGQTFQLYGPVDLTAGIIGSYQRKDGQGWSRGYIGPLVALSAASPISIMGATPRITLVPGHLVKARTVVHFSTEWRF